MKKLVTLSVLLAVLSLVVPANAGFDFPLTMTDDFGGVATVTSTVEEITPQQEYKYSYTITATDDTYANFFSILIPSNPDISIETPMATVSSEIEPLFWWALPTTGDVVYVQAMFSDLLTDGQQSATLVFTSSKGPQETTALFTGGPNTVYEATVYAPDVNYVPEPATVGILAIGALVALRRKKA